MLEIIADDDTPLVTNADGSHVFRLDNEIADEISEIVISDLRISGGDTFGSGGGIFSRENLALSGVTIVDNAASNDGGGIYMQYGSLTVGGSTISNNKAGDDGGGLFIENVGGPVPNVTISNSTISTNEAGDKGAGHHE